MLFLLTEILVFRTGGRDGLKLGSFERGFGEGFWKNDIIETYYTFSRLKVSSS